MVVIVEHDQLQLWHVLGQDTRSLPLLVSSFSRIRYAGQSPTNGTFVIKINKPKRRKQRYM